MTIRWEGKCTAKVGPLWKSSNNFKNTMLWHIKLLYKVKSLCQNHGHLIKIKENLLKANTLVYSNILSPFLAIFLLGTKTLDAFKCFYVAGRMDFSMYLDSQRLYGFCKPVSKHNLFKCYFLIWMILFHRDGLAEWTEYCIFSLCDTFKL